jgi:predicted ATPase/class 3 adenylate cyclase
VTFLFTDLERSTRLWELERAAMPEALRRHDEILQGAIEGHAGYRVKGTGDGVHAAFATAEDAITAAVAAQLALTDEDWGDIGPLRVRMGIHTGSAELRDDDYFGPALNRAARLMAAAHGGQIVTSNATEELVRDALPATIDLEDLGEHHLRDLSRPERVFQVRGPGLPSHFPELRSLVVERTNLPVQTTSFVGRERSLGEVDGALRESRVVTLTGVGGVGKTRLALEAAARFVADVGDGCWLVELAPVTEPGAVIEVVAAALDVTQRPGRALGDSLLEYLRMKHLVLVLDNCEHLLDPVARFVDDVLGSCPRVSVLATSREGLGVAGERIIAVPSLALPREDDELAHAGDAEAVRLFATRAAAAKAGFAVTNDNAAALCRLVRRLDGIPLAIELAAARVRSLTPKELADRVDERFRLLAGGRRTAVERHQTLRRAIDWSYELLAPAEQQALARAAVFAGGFSLRAAEAVIAGDVIDDIEVFDLLARLVDKSLVVAEDLDGQTWYRLLETIRSYGQERLEAAGDAEAVRRRHAEYYVAFAATAGAGLRGPDEASWSAAVDDELDNLRAALNWAVADGDADLALRIVTPLAVQGSSVGYTATAWSETVLGIQGAREHELYAEALSWAAWSVLLTGDLDRAKMLATEAIELAHSTVRSDSSICRVLWPAMGVFGYVGDGEVTGPLAAEMAELARARGDDYDLANALTFVAIGFMYAGETSRSRAPIDEALTIARRHGNPTARAYAGLLGGLCTMDDDPRRALTLFDEGLAAAISVRNHVAMGLIISNSAYVYLEIGRPAEAARRLLQSIEYADSIGDRTTLRVSTTFATIMMLAATGADESAAVLAGAAWTWATAGTVFDRFVQAMEDVRRNLGEERFAMLEARGASLDDDEVRALVRRELEPFLESESAGSPAGSVPA